MRAYETLFVLKPDLEKEKIEESVDKVKAIIETTGTIEKVDDWGKRRLAYEIDGKYQEGHYALIEFKSDNSVLEELDHLYKINESFIRSIVIKREK